MKAITILLLAACATLAQTLPRVHDTDMTYLGSFALPQETNGTSRFGYGGYGVSAHNGTLFLSGHEHHGPQHAQVRIPDTLGRGSWASLPRATWLQPFTNVVEGSVRTAAGITTSDGEYLYGTLVYNGRLIIAAGEWYGCTQQRSHGFRSLNLSETGSFRGFYRIQAAANVRALGGPMAHVPPEWQAALGGPVIGGMWGTAILSCLSAGPSLTVFNPDSIGLPGHAGSTVVHYPVTATSNHSLCEGAACSEPAPEAATSNLYNHATRYAGIAFPAGTRSVLLFGRQGTGTSCYGTPAECGGDPAEADGKGPHAFPYRFQVWAYDVQDFLRVRRGEVQPWEIRPYAYWAVNDLGAYVAPGFARVRGAGYDPATRRWYVTTYYGEQPRVDVFRIRDFGTPPPDTTTPPDTVLPPPPPCIPDTVVRTDTLVRVDTLRYFRTDTLRLTDTLTVRDTVLWMVRDTLYRVPKAFRVLVED